MGLIAWYKLDGDATDSSGNNRNGTITNVTFSSGKINQAGVFNNSSRYILSPIVDHFGSISASAWIYSTDLTTVYDGDTIRGIISNHNYLNTANFTFFINNSNLKVHAGYTDGTRNAGLHSSTTLSINTWYHVAFTYNNTTKNLRIYINGNLDCEITLSKTVKFLPYRFVIGNWAPSYIGRYEFEGMIDDVRIYDYCLSKKEIKELAKAKVLHYSFNDFQEPTENISSSDMGFSVMGEGGISYSYVGIEDGWRKYSISGTGSSSTYPYTFNIKPSSILLSQRTSFSWKYKTNVENKYVNWGSFVMTNISYAPGIITKNVVVGDYRDCAYQNVSPASGSETQHQSIYFHSRPIEGIAFNPATDFIYFKDVQAERKPYATPFVNGTRNSLVKDNSGYENDAELALSTTPRWVEDAKMGTGAYSTNHVGGHKHIDIQSFSFDSNTPFSTSYWFKPTAWNFRVLNNSNNITGSFGHSSDSLIWYKSGTNFSLSKSFSLNQWNHFVLTRENGVIKGYVNGDYAGGATDTITFILDRIGGISSGTSWITYDYQVDDVRIYATALSADDIKELYNIRAQIDNHGNLFTHNIHEPEEILLIKEQQKNVYDNTYRSLGTWTIQETDVSKFVESDYTLGNTKVHGWVFCSSVDYYLTNMEYTKENNTKGFKKTVYTTSSWKAGWNEVFFDVGGYIDEENTPWHDMTRVEFYRSGDATGVDTSQYIIIKDLKLVKYLDNSVIKTELKNTGIFKSFIFSEIGITNGLVAWYPLNGDAEDYVDNNNATAYGTPTITSGLNQQAYSFNGSTDYFRIDEVSALLAGGDFTLSAWINGASQDHKGIVPINTFFGGNRALWLIRTAGMGIYDGSNWYIGDINVGDSNWHHVVITYDISSSTAKLYADAELDFSQVTGDIITIASNDRVSIGQEWDVFTPTDFFNGKIQDVKIFNRVLTPQEVAIEYDLVMNSKMKISKDNIYIAGEFQEN